MNINKPDRIKTGIGEPNFSKQSAVMQIATNWNIENLAIILGSVR